MLDVNSIVGTERTEKLCREIAQRSDGVCTLGFSRGKDSVAAFLWVRAGRAEGNGLTAIVLFRPIREQSAERFGLSRIRSRIREKVLSARHSAYWDPNLWGRNRFRLGY